MKTFVIGTICSLTALSCFCQQNILLLLSQLPANHPDSSTIYVAGSFNGWNPADPSYVLTPGKALAIPAGRNLEWKLTRGSWQTVECSSTGTDTPNRQWTPGEHDTLHIKVEGWKDLLTPVPVSTRSENVVEISEFPVPQMGTSRNIWVYLPQGYASTADRYPVLYMLDGQNLFDERTSFAGEWQVDETLNRLEDSIGLAVIVVGIANGESERLAEYTPWPHERHGGGKGQATVDFITKSLKPFIDSTYRTQPAAETTGIAGSSLGGLLALYAGLSQPGVFGRVGALSGAYWVNKEVYSFAARNPPAPNCRMFVCAGLKESDLIVHGNRQLMKKLGTGKNIHYLEHEGREHHEPYWRDTMAEMVRWLFE